jgi:uncharacterized protein (UPF0147 family)
VGSGKLNASIGREGEIPSKQGSSSRDANDALGAHNRSEVVSRPSALVPNLDRSTGKMSASNRTSQARARVVAALAVGATKQQAALLGGVTDRTVRRWWDEALESEVAQAKFDMGVVTTARLFAAASTAASVLAEIVDDQNVPTAIRLRAASVVLQCARQWRDSEEVERRITLIEERLGNGPN